MLRGFRWQLLAFVVSIVVFAIVLLITQSSLDSDDPQGNPTQVTSVTQPTVDTPVQVQTVTPETVSTVVSVESNVSTEDDPQLSPVQRSSDGIATYREAVIGNIQRLNPLFANLNPVENDITSLIFEGLMGINEYGEPEPVLAREVVVSFDQLEYVITLRDDVLWQDGMPFDADDVIFTVSMLSASGFAGDPELGAFWRTVEIERLGDYLIRFRLTQPLSSFLEALRIGILPEHILRGTPSSQLASHPFNLDPIGTGSYQLEEIRAQNNQVTAINLRVSTTFRNRADVVDANFGVERLSFQFYSTFDEILTALEDRDVDGFAARSSEERNVLLNLASRSTEFSILTSVEPTVGMLVFNWASEDFPVFSDRRMRQALQVGLERQAIVERHLLNSAVPADSPLPLNSWAYSSSITQPAIDPTLARDLISRVSLPESESAETDSDAPDSDTENINDIPRLIFNLLTPDNPALVSLAQDIAAQWTQIDPVNILVQVEAVPTDIYLARLEAGDFHTVLVELSKNGNADPDVYTFWHQGQYPDGQNYGGANDRATSELLERARRDWNGINRIEIYQNFQQEFIDNAVAIPLYYPLYTYIFPADVSGVQLGFLASSSDRFQTINLWQMP